MTKRGFGRAALRLSRWYARVMHRPTASGAWEHWQLNRAEKGAHWHPLKENKMRFAWQQHSGSNVRFGSKADIHQPSANVRFGS